jgi:hypothetical protein
VPQLAVDRLQRRGPGLQLTRQPLQTAGLLLSLTEGGADGAGGVLHPLGSFRCLLPESRGAGEMLCGFVQCSLALVQLLPQETDPFLDLIDLLGPALQPAYRLVDRAHPALGVLD